MFQEIQAGPKETEGVGFVPLPRDSLGQGGCRRLAGGGTATAEAARGKQTGTMVGSTCSFIVSPYRGGRSRQ